MSADGRPLEDTIAEAERVAGAARAQGVGVKLLGGAGIRLHSPSSQHSPLKRKYGDLDYVVASKDRKAVLAFFPAIGYEANDRFNLMQGDRRLYFFDANNGKQVDVFIDVFRMSHVLDLRNRLAHDGPCATPSDLLLSKLQIYEVNRKDLIDAAALVLDHPIASNGDDAIDAAYVTRLACEDWGLCRTLQLNLGKLRQTVAELDINRDVVNSRLDELWAAIEAGPKPLKWRMRAQVGDRMRWYELPEEVRSPYQAE